MATVRKMWRCTNSQCKNGAGKHRGYKKVCTGEKQALCKHCGSSMVLSQNHVTRIQRDGQTFTKSVSPSKEDASAYLASCITARHSGALMPGEERLIPWSEAQRIFEEDMENRLAKGKSPETVLYYRSCMKQLTAYFKDSYLQNIEDKHVRAFMKMRLKTAGNSIVNGNVAILKVLYKLVCKQKKARKYPRLHETYIDIFNIEREGKVKRRDIILETAEEIDTFLSYCKNPVLHHFVFGILNTGLRHRDMLKLREPEFNWQKGEIHTTVKGGKEVWIPLTNQYADYVKEWLKCRRVITLQRYLFPNMKKPGECLTVHSLFEWDGTCKRVAEHFDVLKKPAIAAKFRALTPHHLRHTFATHYLYKTSLEYGSTIAVFKLSMILGHSTEYITKTYLHRLGEQDQAAMQSFGDQMFQGGIT